VYLTQDQQYTHIFRQLQWLPVWQRTEFYLLLWFTSS